jgi:uncharacterized protein (TIGR02246 family)
MENKNQVVEFVVGQLMSAWHDKDPKKFADMFSTEAIFTNVLGDVAQGKQQIENMHVFPFYGPLKDAHQEYNIVHKIWINEDSVLTDVRWVCFNQKIPGSEQVLPPRKGLINLVIKRSENGTWKIMAGYNTDYTATYQRVGNNEDEVITKKEFE